MNLRDPEIRNAIAASVVLAAALGARAADVVPREAIAALSQSSGILTPQIRAAYIDWVQDRVLAELSAKHESIPPDCLDEVRKNSTLRDAIFASVYPPDPDILLNYDRLRTQLGPAFMGKYRSLVIGAAVAHRASGVPELDEKDFDVPATEPADRDDTPEANDATATAVAKYLTDQKLTALELYKDAGKRQQLLDSLSAHGGVDRRQIEQMKKDKYIAKVLKKAMIVLGQRPAHREAKPPVVTWLKYLATTYEADPSTPKRKKGKGEMDWPLFPMDKAPWPLLMPLARPLPLGEARYIWERFNGQHGPDRYHSYGPYKKFDGQILKELEPSPWHWDAWPDRIVHGGVCTVMCTITIDLHSALCVPSVHAGQPHHANLMTYHYGEDGQWKASIDQAFAGGPPVTHAAWPFRDDDDSIPRMSGKGVGSEYHLGLAQGMNVGLKSYIDTRIAVALFKAMSPSQQKEIGVKLLTQMAKENPYNPAVWYLLASQTSSATQGLELARTVDARGPDEKKKHEPPVAEYWHTLTQFVVEQAILRHPVSANQADARRVYDFLKSGVPGVSDEDLTPYAKRFAGNPPGSAASR